MKKILLSSLLAVMAVTSANAKIASTEYADSVAESKAAAAEAAANSYTDQEIDALDATTNGNGVVVTNVTQTDGVVTVTKGNIAYSSLTGTPTVDTAMSDSSANAVQNKVIKSYVDNAINTVEGEIGDGYQKLSDKLKSSDTSTQVTDANKDTLYPTVGKTQMIADAAQAAANSYTDQEIGKKQDTLSTAQLNAVNSGITAAKVTQYDGYASGKQNTLSTAQLAAVDSGITAAKVTQYDGYASGKQNTLSETQMAAVNSGATAAIISATSAFQAAVEAGTVNEEGTYVLTAKVDAQTKKVTGYAWENIDRSYE